MRRKNRRRPSDSGEFLWLTSLSDLMILLFIFFVVMFSFSYKKMKEADFERIVATLRNQPQPKDPMDDIQAQLNDWAKQSDLNGLVQVKKVEDAVLVEIKDQVLFPSGKYELSSQGLSRLGTLTQVLEKIPPRFRLGIEGHTDDVPIHTKDIKDNWELSSKRALGVLYALNLSPQLSQRTQILAFGETKPLLPNRDETGQPIEGNQSKNRRVTLRVF